MASMTEIISTFQPVSFTLPGNKFKTPMKVERHGVVCFYDKVMGLLTRPTEDRRKRLSCSQARVQKKKKMEKIKSSGSLEEVRGPPDFLRINVKINFTFNGV